MSKSTQESQQEWIATIADNYGREINSPFELNMMEAKIRKNIRSPQKRRSAYAPVFALACSTLLALAWLFAPEPSHDLHLEKNQYVQVDEPSISLFSVGDLNPSDDSFLPDDYITISQVMFD